MSRGKGHRPVLRGRATRCQPRPGDLVLACEHLGAPRVTLRFFDLGGALVQSPDGRHIAPRFAVACNCCLRRVRNDFARVAYNEIIWGSNGPVIMAPEKGLPSDIAGN